MSEKQIDEDKLRNVTKFIIKTLEEYEKVPRKLSEEEKKMLSTYFQECYQYGETSYIDEAKRIAQKITSSETMSKEKFAQYDEIFQMISYNYNIFENNFIRDILIPLFQKGKELNVRVNTIEKIIDAYITEKILNPEMKDNQELQEIIEQYYKEQIQKDSIEIANNSSISHLINSIHQKIFSQEFSDKLKSDIELRIEGSKVPDMLEYFFQLKEGKKIETSQKADFEEKIAEIKLQLGRIPQIYCDYILREQKDSKFNQGIYERAVEDFTEYELQEEQINDCSVRVLDQEVFKPKTSKAMCITSKNKDEIQISKKLISGKKDLFHIVQVISHECEHAKVMKEIREHNIDYKKYQIIKEMVLQRGLKDLYYENYEYMYDEINARMQGHMRADKILKRMGFSELDINLRTGYSLKTKVNEYNKEMKEAEIKSLYGKKANVNEMFEVIVRNDTEVLEQYPIFEIEFENIDGKIQRKSYIKMLKEFEQKLSQSKDQKEIERTSNLYTGIMREHSLSPYNKDGIEEYEQLMNFNSDNEIVEAFKERIIREYMNNTKQKNSLQEMYKKSNASQRYAASKQISALERQIDKSEEQEQK